MNLFDCTDNCPVCGQELLFFTRSDIEDSMYGIEPIAISQMKKDVSSKIFKIAIVTDIVADNLSNEPMQNYMNVEIDLMESILSITNIVNTDKNVSLHNKENMFEYFNQFEFVIGCGDLCYNRTVYAPIHMVNTNSYHFPLERETYYVPSIIHDGLNYNLYNSFITNTHYIGFHYEDKEDSFKDFSVNAISNLSSEDVKALVKRLDKMVILL